MVVLDISLWVSKQWGLIGTEGQRPTVKFPITFSAIYSVVINNGGNNTTRIQGDCNAYNITTSGFTMYIVGDSSRYIAIGK